MPQETLVGVRGDFEVAALFALNAHLLPQARHPVAADDNALILYPITERPRAVAILLILPA